MVENLSLYLIVNGDRRVIKCASGIWDAVPDTLVNSVELHIYPLGMCEPHFAMDIKDLEKLYERTN